MCNYVVRGVFEVWEELSKERIIVCSGSCSEVIVLLSDWVIAFGVMVCVKEVVEEASVVEGDGRVGVAHSLTWRLVGGKEVGDECGKDSFTVENED